MNERVVDPKYHIRGKIGEIFIVEDGIGCRCALSGIASDYGQIISPRSLSGVQERVTRNPEPPFLIFLDINFKEYPDFVDFKDDPNYRDGLGLLKHLRTNIGWAKVPIAMITADNTSEPAIAATKLGAFGYIKKPFDLDYLRRTITDQIVLAQKA